MEYGTYKIHLRTKFALAIILFALILGTGIIVISYSNYKQSMEEKYVEHITSVVNSAAEFVSELDIDFKYYIETAQQYVSEGKNPDELFDEKYLRLKRYLQILLDTNGLDYLYSYHPTEDKLYMFMQVVSEENKGLDTEQLGDYNEAGVDECTEEDILLVYEQITNPDAEQTLISETKFGYLVTEFITLNDKDGNPYLVLGADMSMQKIKEELNKYLFQVIINEIVIIAIFVILFIIIMRFTMINPLQKLVDGAVKFVQSDPQVGGQSLTKMNIQVHTGDEIEDLARAFNKMTEDIVSYITNLTKITAERERIDAELHVATNIQASMLPSKFPAFPDRNEFDIFATMTPAKEVGGDLYDFFMLDDNHIALVLGDVSGKGVPAALFMVKAKTAIRNAAMEGLSPAEVFTKANEQLCDNNVGQLFVTGWMGVLDITTGVMTCVNAGHNPPIFRKPDGTCEYLKMRPGFVLAGMEGLRYKQFELQFEEGSAIYIYTDGVTEATDAHDELYGEDRLIEFINKHNADDPEKLLKEIKADVDKFVGEAPQFDDITMLGFTYKWKKKLQ